MNQYEAEVLKEAMKAKKLSSALVGLIGIGLTRPSKTWVAVASAGTSLATFLYHYFS